MKRKPLPPDLRPDWRDPDMLVLTSSKSAGGLIPVEPERIVKVSNYRLAMSDEPTWRNDPTYNLRKKK